LKKPPLKFSQRFWQGIPRVFNNTSFDQARFVTHILQQALHIISLGNSSLEGARLALLSREKIDEAETLAKSITYFELNNNREFMKKFTSGLFLPHMDLNRYPSVKKKLHLLHTCPRKR